MNDSVISDSPSLDSGKPPHRAGALSTFVKFLMFVAIVGLGVALLLPAVRTAREPARRNSCLNNLKQIGLGLSNYEAANGAYPPAYTVDADGKPLHSWRTLILPYMEQQSLYKRIDLSKPWDDPTNKAAYNSMPEVYRCPSDPSATDHNLTNYLAIVTPDSAIRTTDSLAYADLPNPAQTLLVIDVGPKQATHWMSPVDADEQLLLSLGPDSKLPHNGDIFLATYADGHGSSLRLDTAASVRRALITASADDNDELQDNDW